jgi:hypothetical protein
VELAKVFEERTSWVPGNVGEKTVVQMEEEKKEKYMYRRGEGGEKSWIL